MPSPITTVMSTIASDWVATAPPDLPEIAYEYVDYRPLDEESVASDRAFFFQPPQRVSVESETSSGSLVSYELEAVLVLSDNGRTEVAFNEAIANEASLLMRRVEARTSWGAGIWEVETQGVEVERDEESGAAIITLRFTALVGEQ